MTCDLSELRGIQSDLALATDAGRWDDFVGCFVSGALVDYGSLGSGPVERIVESIRESQSNYQGTMNIVGTHSAQVDGDRAVAETYVVSHHFRADGNQSWDDQAGTHYVDRLVRCSEGWRISERTAHLRWIMSVLSETGWL